MDFFDWLIIYLTCGAPLGVFYFLQNRKNHTGVQLWLKTFLTFIFWLPFGFRLLANKAGGNFTVSKKIFSKTSKTEEEIYLFRKQLEETLRKSSARISIFEFREVFERYVGLTIAGNSGSEKIPATEKEIFRVENKGNVEIGAICLNRRNLKRLEYHQTQARQDFFQSIDWLAALASDKRNFVKSAADFFRLLKDSEAQLALEKISCDISQNEKDFAVKISEHYKRKTEKLKPAAAKSTAMQLQTLTAQANSTAKD